ncbi:MAG TPA: hypothetical protein GX507_04420 [Clostridia bacterium]|nr:hypothetical protein [Clostridia bacterium]
MSELEGNPISPVETEEFPLPIPERGKLTEFRFDEPLSAPTGPPVGLLSTTLATAFILADDPGDRIWINATLDWRATFTTVGIAYVTFQLLRNEEVIYSAVQSVFNPVAPTPPATAVVTNVLRMQYVDTPLAGAAKAEIVPVVYSLLATTTFPNISTVGPITLSVAEIEPNTLP